MCTNRINTLGGNNLSQRGGAVKPLGRSCQAPAEWGGLSECCKIFIHGEAPGFSLSPKRRKKGKNALDLGL